MREIRILVGIVIGIVSLIFTMELFGHLIQDSLTYKWYEMSVWSAVFLIAISIAGMLGVVAYRVLCWALGSKYKEDDTSSLY